MKRVIPKIAETADDLIGKKIVDIMEVPRTSPPVSSKTDANEAENIGLDRKIPKENIYV